MESLTDIYKQVISRDNLYASAYAASRGKRFKNAVAKFNFLHEWEIDRLRRDLPMGATSKPLQRPLLRWFFLVAMMGWVVCGAGSAWAQYLGGSGSGDSYGRYPPALLASTAQNFTINGASTSAGIIEVMQDTAGAGTGIITSSGIKINIPSGLPMTWDSSITSATITGTASSDVSATVSYANSNTTLVITVTGNFSDGDYILISGLNFKSFTSGNAGELMLDIGATYGYDADNTLQAISGAPIYYYGGNGDGYGSYDFQTQQGQMCFGSAF